MKKDSAQDTRAKTRAVAAAVATKAGGTVVGHLVIAGWHSLRSHDLIAKAIEAIGSLFN